MSLNSFLEENNQRILSGEIDQVGDDGISDVRVKFYGLHSGKEIFTGLDREKFDSDFVSALFLGSGKLEKGESVIAYFEEGQSFPTEVFHGRSGRLMYVSKS